jgi:hypothetical protein
MFRLPLVATLAIASLAAADGSYFDGTSLEATVFGLSYHTNRHHDWNEVNPGTSLSLVKPLESYNNDMLFTIGTYDDSDRHQAKFALIGARHTIGDRKAGHITGSLSAGYFEGSGLRGFGIIPVVSIGYNRVDVCITGDPYQRTESYTYNRLDYPDGHTTIDYTYTKSSTAIIAAYIQFRLATF